MAGQADILVVPDLESGNMLAKQLEYLADAQAAGIVLGARVPIVLTSRASSPFERIASCALTVLVTRHPKPRKPEPTDDLVTAPPALARSIGTRGSAP